MTHERRFPDDMTVGAARASLPQYASEGVNCPCCGRLVKTYSRPLNSVMARFVAALYDEHGREWAQASSVARKQLPDVAHQGGQMTLAHHWGLIEPEPQLRGDQGRSGYWRVTPRGEDWLTGLTTVPKYAHIAQGHCLALDGPLLTREDALGEHFDFTALMRHRSPHTPPPSLFDAMPDREAA